MDSAGELKCTIMSWFVVLEDLHITCSVPAVFCCLICSYSGQMLSTLKFHLDRTSGCNKGNVSMSIQTDSTVTCTDKKEDDDSLTCVPKGGWSWRVEFWSYQWRKYLVLSLPFQRGTESLKLKLFNQENFSSLGIDEEVSDTYSLEESGPLDYSRINKV